MKKGMLISIIWLLSVSLYAFADKITILDKQGTEIELEEVRGKIELEVGRFHLTIPTEMISSINLAEDGKTLLLTTSITDREVKGTVVEDIKSELKGSWELGEYSIALSDIRSYKKESSSDKFEQLQLDQPDGFFAICTDEAGRTMELYNFRYRIHYRYSSPYINVSSRDEYEYRRYLPIRYKDAIMVIPFTDIDSIELEEREPEDPAERDVWEPPVIIKLLDGGVMKCNLARLQESSYAWKFAGEVQRGGLIETVSKIVFNHKQDKEAPRESIGHARWDSERIEYNDDQSTNSPDSPESIYTASIKTWKGNQLSFLNLCRFEVYDGYRWGGEQKTDFQVKIGASTGSAEFDKIKSLSFREKGSSEMELTTSSGKIVRASLPSDEYRDFWIGGNLGGELEGFGLARIEISNIASLEISVSAKK